MCTGSSDDAASGYCADDVVDAVSGVGSGFSGHTNGFGELEKFLDMAVISSYIGNNESGDGAIMQRRDRRPLQLSNDYGDASLHSKSFPLQVSWATLSRNFGGAGRSTQLQNR